LAPSFAAWSIALLTAILSPFTTISVGACTVPRKANANSSKGHDESSFGEGQRLAAFPAIFDDFFKTYRSVFR